MSAGTRAMIDWMKDKNPDIWFATTPLLNWDNAVPVLKWIASQPQCDKANAAMIFWFADPGYYAARIADGEQPRGESRALIEAIIRNCRNGLYARSELAWPDADGRGFLNAYERSVAGNPKARTALEIPPELFGPFPGRAPRVPAALTPKGNAELWDLLNRLGTQAGFRPGSELWRAQQEGRWKPAGAPGENPSHKGKAWPRGRAAGFAWLGLSALLLLWVLYVNLLRQ